MIAVLESPTGFMMEPTNHPRPGKKRPKYKNVNIPIELWEMVMFVTTVRAVNVGEYLRPLIEPQVTKDFTYETERVQQEQAQREQARLRHTRPGTGEAPPPPGGR